MFIYIDLIFWSHEVSFFFSFPSDLIIIMWANMFVLHGYKDISGSGIKLKEFLTYVWIDKWEFERSHLSFICREIIIPQLSDLFQSCWIPVVARPTLNECPLYANKVVKNLPDSEEEVRDVKFDLWIRKIAGRGHGNPHQYSCLENPMSRAAWWATVHSVAKSWTRQGT